MDGMHANGVDCGDREEYDDENAYDDNGDPPLVVQELASRGSD
jgi:hypothetical protein